VLASGGVDYDKLLRPLDDPTARIKRMVCVGPQKSADSDWVATEPSGRACGYGPGGREKSHAGRPTPFAKA
jgi:hypothetical protein